MNIDIIKSSERGYFDHGWLKTSHIFSFAGYYNPLRMNFGSLRVFNDDFVSPHNGFGTHPHANMEIITIPIEGSLEHTDSTGVSRTIQPDEVQVMSAGTGIRHSEQNAGNIPVNFFQIWIIPDENNITPRYDQKLFENAGHKDNFQLLVSPDGRENSLQIHQNAFISRRLVKSTENFIYMPYEKTNGILLFIVEGSSVVGGTELLKRDSATIININEPVEIKSQSNSSILILEVPV